MRALLRFSVHHPRIILGAVAAVSLSLGFCIPRVQLRLDARSLIPANHPDLAASDAAASLFGLRDVVLIGVARKDSDIYNRETLARVERLSQGLARVDGVVPSSVRSIATTPRLFIRDNRMDVRPLLLSGAREEADAAMRVRRDVEALGLNDGVLVAVDGKAAAIFGEIRTDADRYQLFRQVKELTDTEAVNGDSIYLSGTALAQAVLGEASAQDLMRLVPLVIIVLGAVLMAAFRHPAPALISLVEIGLSLVWTVGLLGLGSQSVFVTTLVLPVILISVGISDDVYVMKRYFKEARRGAPQGVEELIFNVFSAMIWPIGLTTLSTIVGLLSLAATNLEPLRVFGLFGALAILFSTLFTFSLVPALLVLINPDAPRKEKAPEEKKGLLSSLFDTLIAAGPRRILAVIIVIAICAIFLTTRLRVDDSWIKNLPPASEVAQGDKGLNRLLAGTTTLDLMVDSGQPLGLLEPQSLMALLTLEESLAALPCVGASHGIHDDVVRLNASLRGLSYSEYRDSLLRGRIKLSRGEIEQALMLLTVARRASLGAWIDDGYRRARLTVFIRSADYERIAGVLRVADAEGHKFLHAGGSVTPFGDAFVSYTTVRLLVEGQTYSITIALFTDLFLLALLFKSLRASLLAITPVAFSVLVVFGCLALTGTSLGIANSMFAGIAIGIGLDFAIHLTAAYRRERRKGLLPQEAMRHAFVSTGPAITTGAGAIAVGFSVLALSQIMPNVQLGLMICLSITVCAFATLLFIPSMVMALRSKS